jgi:hypothetical protein
VDFVDDLRDGSLLARATDQEDDHAHDEGGGPQAQSFPDREAAGSLFRGLLHGGQTRRRGAGGA